MTSRRPLNPCTPSWSAASLSATKAEAPMATFVPGLHRSPTRSVEDSQMTVLDHLSALRRTLIVSILAWSVATAVAFLVWGRVLQLLIHQGGIGAVYYTTPAGAFTLALKISLYLGFVLASPVIIQQIWWFVSPGRSEEHTS